MTAPSVWDGLRAQSLFITGGTGFVGKWLLECLLHADRELELGLALTVLTREPDRFARDSAHLAKAPALQLLKGDVASFEFPQTTFTTAIHAALPVASARAGLGDLPRLAQAGAQRVCEFAAARGVRRLLHISSGAVYGAHSAAATLSEDLSWSGAATANHYTCAKRLAEGVVGLDWPFEVVVARCFAFIGPYLSGDSGAAAAEFVEQVANGRGIVVEGSGDAIRAYQYAGDMARWLLSSLVLGAPGRIYNIGGDSEVTIAQLADEVTRIAGLSESVRMAGRAVEGLAGQRYVPDIRRAANELGLFNAVGLDEAIRRTLSWRAGARNSVN